MVADPSQKEIASWDPRSVLMRLLWGKASELTWRFWVVSSAVI